MEAIEITIMKTFAVTAACKWCPEA